MHISKLCRCCFALLLLKQELVVGLQINILQITMGDSPVFGYAIQGPAMDVAFQHALKMYPAALHNITRTTIYKPGNFTCADSAEMIPIVAAETDAAIRQLDGFTVLFTTEWNLPVLSTMGSDKLLRDTMRYPTLVTFTSDSDVIMKSILSLLQRYQWTTVSVLCDTLSTLPLNAVFPATTCRNLVATLHANDKYTLYVQQLDSRADHSADAVYKNVLQTAATQSRVIMLASDPARVRNVMVEAFKLNMTNGDYIYIAPVSTRVPGEGEMTWRAHDEDDPNALAAFESLIYVFNPNPDWIRIGDTLKEMAVRSASADYHHALTNDTMLNVIGIIAYETMSALAMVLNETFKDLSSLDAVGFREKFLNRTFDLTSRAVTIKEGGYRVSNVLCTRLNVTSAEMETAWQYYAVAEELSQVSALGGIWPNGLGPPRNSPQCGFQNDLCLQSGYPILSPLAISLLVLLGGIVLGSSLIAWRKTRRDAYTAASTWWVLEPSCLENSEKCSFNHSQMPACV